MNKAPLSLIIRYLNKPRFIVGLILTFIGTSMSLFIPKFMGDLLNIEFLTTLISTPTTIVLVISSFLLIFITQALSSYLIGLCGSQALNKVQNHIYNNLLKTAVKKLDEYSAGDLSSRLTNDMSIVLNFITVVLPNLLLNVVVIIGSIYFLFTISPSLTLLSLSLFPILLFVIVPINNKLEEQYTNYQEGLGDISSRISHKFNHIRLIKSFNGETSEAKMMSLSFNKLTRSFKKIIGLSAIQNTLVNSLIMGFIMMLVIAGLEVSKGSMTMSSLMAFVLYLTQLIDPMTDLSEAMTELTEFNSVSSRLLEIMELDKESTEGIYSDVQETSIVMKDVNFAYDTENILNDFSATISEGQHVAIVGPSGAGKSTIFSLLMKFYSNYQGRILIGSRSLSDLQKAS